MKISSAKNKIVQVILSQHNLKYAFTFFWPVRNKTDLSLFPLIDFPNSKKKPKQPA